MAEWDVVSQTPVAQDPWSVVTETPAKRVEDAWSVVDQRPLNVAANQGGLPASPAVAQPEQTAKPSAFERAWQTFKSMHPVAAAAGEGAVEKFGAPYLGEWMQRHEPTAAWASQNPALASVVSTAGAPIEIPSKLFNAAIGAYHGGVKEAGNQLGIDTSRFARDTASMAEYAMQQPQHLRRPAPPRAWTEPVRTTETARPVEGEVIPPRSEWVPPERSSAFEFKQDKPVIEGEVVASGALPAPEKPGILRSAAQTAEPRPASLSSAAPEGPLGTAPLPPDSTVAQTAVLDRIGKQPEPANIPTKTDLYTDYVDNLHPIRKLVEATGDNLDTALNPYEQFRLTRGVGGKADHFLKYGTFDFNTLRDVGPSFDEIMRPIAKDKDAFKAYLVSKRALELEQQGVQTGIPLDAARQVVQDGARFEPQAQALQRYQAELLNYAKSSGLLSENVVAAMREASKDYVPFYRIMDDTRTQQPGMGFSTRTPTFRIKGSERQIADPLESVIRNTQTFITLAERNRAINTFIDFAKDHPELTTAKRVPQAKEITVHGDEVANFLEELGIPSQLYGDLGRDSFSVMRSMDKSLGPDQVAAWKDGKRQVYELDPQIAQIIKGMDQKSLDTTMKMLSIPAKLLRAGVVLSPEYMIRNITRDQMNAFVQSKHGYVPIYDLLRGMSQTMRGGTEFRNWLKSGGSQAALVAMDRDLISREAWTYGARPTAGQRAKNVITKPLDILRAVSEALDNATRVGEYMRATNGSQDPATMMRGGMAARDVTQDFQRIGAKTRAMNAITAFMNAQIQGLDREVSTFKHRPGPAIAKAAALITLPSVLLWAANHGDPRYENAPDWEKDQFWFILPEDKSAEPLRVPKPFTMGAMFGSLPERILSDYVSKKPEAYNNFLKNLSGTIMPNMIPTFALPMMEQFGNRSQFLDRPLVGPRLDRLMPAEQSTQFTPEVAKLAARGVSKIPGMEESKLASPIILQNYVSRWGGTLGQYAMSAGDKGLKALGLVDPPVGPTRMLSDIPVLRAFVSRYPTATAQPIQDFFEKSTTLQKLDASSKMLNKAGAEEPAAVYREQVVAKVDATRRQLEKQFGYVRNTYADRELTPEAKREQLTQQYMQMLNIAQEGLKTIRDAEKRSIRDRATPRYGGTE